MTSDRLPLSSCPTARTWLGQFLPADRPVAASMLDAMLLLNEEQVSAALRSLLYRLAHSRKRTHRRIALHAEREFGGAPVFEIRMVADSNGRIRRRSTGSKGPLPVKPARGGSRVGSEGMVAFIISINTKPSSVRPRKAKWLPESVIFADSPFCLSAETHLRLRTWPGTKVSATGRTSTSSPLRRPRCPAWPS